MHPSAFASSWLKRHEPVAFLPALLNSQPMGFYSASQLVQGAVRHGVKLRPIDITVSGWEAVLEPSGKPQHAVRLGFNPIHRMEREAAWGIEKAGAVRRFDYLHDLGVRAGRDAAHLKLLASANALAPLSGNRREAMWNAANRSGRPGATTCTSDSHLTVTR